jgi:hypothetical protein
MGIRRIAQKRCHILKLHGGISISYTNIWKPIKLTGGRLPFGKGYGQQHTKTKNNCLGLGEHSNKQNWGRMFSLYNILCEYISNH